MPDDRFADLGGGERPSAAERLADLDAREPQPPDPRRFQQRYTWVVGVAAVILIAIVAIKTLPNAGLGTHGPEIGHALPRFAAPSVLGTLNGDPNVKQSGRDAAAPNKTPACDVHGPDVINICDLERGPLVITFIGPGNEDCDGYVDRLQRLGRSYTKATFLVVVSGRPKSQVAALARRRGWTLPVAVDRNGVVEQLYRVSLAVCATTSFAAPGGIVRANEVPAQRVSDATMRATLASIGAR